MRVRIDKDVAKWVAKYARKNKRSHAREVAISLSVYYSLKECAQPNNLLPHKT